MRALVLVWDASRRWTVLWLVLLVVQGLLPAVTVRLTKPLVNSLTAVVSSGGNPAMIRAALILALLMGIVMVLGQLLGSVTGWVRTAQAEAVTDYVTAMVHSQCVRLDLAFYDSSQYFDRLHRARAEASYRPLALVESLGGLLQSGITLVAMAAILLPYGAWLPVALLVSTSPALYIALHYRVREHRYQLQIAPDERRTWYYDWLLTAREAAAEMRLFGLGDRFRSAHQALRLKLRTERLRLNRDEGLAQLAASSLALLVTGAVMLWMVWRAIQGQYTLGDLALFYSAFSQGQGLMRSILGNLAQIYGSSLFLADLFEFLALEPQVVDAAEPAAYPTAPTAPSPLRQEPTPPTPVRQEPTPPAPLPAREGGAAVAGPGICFRNVSFGYPGQARMILEGLDLEIAPGQVAAIVGPNGAGKSTLIKLLCRFYDPLAGTVTLDGVDLRQMAQADLRRHITVLFQEPVQYNATVADNIAMGNGAENMGEIEAAARAAGADGPVARLPAGYDTVLGTWFEGGTDLSVGEWQRVALARAFLRQAPVVILDEPTSAMDSWAEADWLARFRQLVAGRTTLIITHRFTTARYADRIHVMDGGRIIESGTHEQLLASGGRYASSWQAQMLTNWPGSVES